jgi:cytochrome c-type biogenesis protein
VIATAAASTPDTTVLAAFAVGVLSFVSPCVLPLVPGYLSAISGVSIAEIRSGERRTWRLLLPSIIFCLSFTLMFVILGMAATKLGSSLISHRETINNIAGWLIIIMGCFFLLAPVLPFLNKEWRPDGLIRRAGTGGPIIAGLAFAVAWTPCAGPTLASILGIASTSSTVYHGGILLAFYSAGLAIPFLLCALAFDRLTTTFAWIRTHYLLITAVGGALLIVTGVMLLTGEFAHLNVEAQKGLDALGLDFFKNV